MGPLILSHAALTRHESCQMALGFQKKGRHDKQGAASADICAAPAESAVGGEAGTVDMVVSESLPSWMVATVICWPAEQQVPV